MKGRNTMSNSKVTIVCTYYNREKNVIESIQSLLDQTYDNIEIIVINDGSTDGTLDQLNTFQDPRLKIITQENQGFINSIRRAIDEASGDFIAIHGSGDISYTERIAKQAEILNKNNNIGVVGCHVLDDTKTGSDTYTLKTENGLNFTKRLLIDNMFTHGEVMFRRDVYYQVGGYRHFFIYAQDHDLWLRMSQHCDYYVVEEVLYRRFRLDTGVSQNTNKLLLQIYLSKFAIECMSQKIITGKDPLDTIGPQSVFLRTPSKKLSYTIAWIGINEMLSGKHLTGINIIKRALNEHCSLKTLGITAIGLSYKHSIFWNNIGKPILNALYQRHLRRIGQK